jgi:hypothetical protein
VGLGLTAGAAVFGGIAYKIASDRDPSLLGIKKNPNETSTPTATATETSIAPEDLQLEQGFLTNNSEVRQSLLRTVWRYDLNGGTEPQNSQPHLPYGVVDGFKPDAAHPAGKRVNLQINDPNAIQKADTLTCQFAFLYTKRVADDTGHTLLVGRFGSYSKPGEKLEDGADPYVFDMPIAYFNPPPANRPNLTFTGLSYLATGAVVVGSPDDTGGGYKAEELEQRLAKLKGQSMLVGVVIHEADDVQFYSESLRNKYHDLIQVFTDQEPAAQALITKRGTAPFAGTSMNRGEKIATRPLVNGLSANASMT